MKTFSIKRAGTIDRPEKGDRVEGKGDAPIVFGTRLYR